MISTRHIGRYHPNMGNLLDGNTRVMHNNGVNLNAMAGQSVKLSSQTKTFGLGVLPHKVRNPYTLGGASRYRFGYSGNHAGGQHRGEE
ncbi:unannotated protein [freshwater metagenome]|uniref:Unannotated protein n=1 Tax=freshwater metagenome TaxID=449393 RepID=A0A6J6XCW1_9ZZZZ